jgi:hypothetical protein
MNSIDERRANFEFIDILKRNKRIVGLGKWLCNETGAAKTIKHIRNLHYIGKLNAKSICKEMKSFNNHVITIPENNHFKMIKDKCYSEIEKLVSYLK